MLNLTIGVAGSFCDQCACPTLRGFELRGPMSSMFYCAGCAERVFGETETTRAVKNTLNKLKGVVDEQKQQGRRVPFFEGEGRPIGFLR